jgi:hypothetical protein
VKAYSGFDQGAQIDEVHDLAAADEGANPICGDLASSVESDLADSHLRGLQDRCAVDHEIDNALLVASRAIKSA